MNILEKVFRNKALWYQCAYQNYIRDRTICKTKPQIVVYFALECIFASFRISFRQNQQHKTNRQTIGKITKCLLQLLKKMSILENPLSL